MPRIFIVILLTLLAYSAVAEPLQYKFRVGNGVPYQYNFTITGQMGMPGAQGGATNCTMYARLVDQVKSVGKDGAASMQMIIKNGAIAGEYGGSRFNEPVPYTTLTFDRSATGTLRNLRYAVAAAKPDLPIPGFENAWLLFSRFGHHFLLPSQELRTGEGWKTREMIGLDTAKQLTLETGNKLVSAKVVNGKRYLQIDSTFQLTAPKQSISLNEQGEGGNLTMEYSMAGASYLLFDPQDGEVFRSMIKATVTTKAALDGNTKQAITGTFTVRGTAEKAGPR